VVIKNWVVNLFLLLSAVGVIDSAYLTISHLRGGESGCFLVEGCDIVLSSSYSEFLGIPVALFGLLFYVVIFTGVFIYNLKRNDLLMRKIALISPLGFLASLCFLYIQAVVLKAFCTYCLLSALLSTIIFILGMYVLLLKREKFGQNKEEMVESEGFNI